MVKNVLTELCSSSPFRGCLCSVGAGRNGVSRSRKGKTCQVRASRQTPLRSFSIPPLEDTEDLEVVLADREEVRRILKEERVAIMCAYMLMHFLKEEPFGFLQL